MANPRRPDPGTHRTDATGTQSGNTWIYGAIAAIVIVLLLVLFLGGYLGDNTARQDDVATPAVTEQGDAEVITSDPAIAPAPTSDAAAPPAAGTGALDDPAPASIEEDGNVIDIEGDAEVEVLDES
ncbi:MULTISPECIES: hypothetical protein [unclassified Yoonia]|uniref:hypothetical protein n=1 Tax=unclassified Yoonia TaxID=2629118 RepID=UPI002AFE7CE1|nr:MULTISPECIES: hypothetical protein [unclassified Yoonia]